MLERQGNGSLRGWSGAFHERVMSETINRYVPGARNSANRNAEASGDRLRKFAQFVASGLSLAESYRRTTGQTKNADVKGTQWHRYAGIKERIAELKAQNSKRAQMTRAELLAFYADVIRTPADQVPPGSPVIQTYEETPEDGSKIRICDKVAAGVQMAKMCDWNSAERVELERELIDELFARVAQTSDRRLSAGGGWFHLCRRYEEALTRARE